VKSIFLFVGLFLAISSCRTPAPAIKIYVSSPEVGGIVRTQAGEIIPYPFTKGYLVLTPTDFEALLNWCNPKDVARVNRVYATDIAINGF